MRATSTARHSPPFAPFSMIIRRMKTRHHRASFRAKIDDFLPPSSVLIYPFHLGGLQARLRGAEENFCFFKPQSSEMVVLQTNLISGPEAPPNLVQLDFFVTGHEGGCFTLCRQGPSTLREPSPSFCIGVAWRVRAARRGPCSRLGASREEEAVEAPTERELKGRLARGTDT